jgi:hypothetical protein
MRRLRHVVALASLVAACGPAGSAPSLDPLTDQVAFVGSEFTLQLRASDPDLDELHFTFTSNIPDIASRAQLRPFGDGSFAEFVWTPVASDVGEWAIDFTVTDGNFKHTETVVIEVKPSVGANGPIFRKPLGTGTTLDLSVKPCLDVEIVVEDADSSQVTLAQDEPVIEGATLSQEGPMHGIWHWCPTAEQIEAMDRYSLTLSADDGENARTIKNYLVVLRKAPKPDCPGTGPTITHTPSDESTVVDLTIDAQIADDVGLKGAPLFYYSTTPPADPPDLGAMTQLTMIQITGDNQSGTWAADVPNPVASLAMGAQVTLYYVMVAGDNDDAAGDCDHETRSPVYQMTVTNPGGGGGLGLCESCTADSQCGGAGDNCVRIGNMGAAFCGKGCTADSECPTDYYCSVTMLSSVDGVAARQCIPDSYTCTAAPPPPPACTDDGKEENDTRAAADGKPALAPGSYPLVSCPDGLQDDEDWFKITIAADSQVTASIAGGAATDLDLALVDSTGAVVAKDESLDSNEMVSGCLVPGTYYLRVYSVDSGENAYTLTWSKTAQSCAAACTDDGEEPDDDANSAQTADLNLGKFTRTTMAICAGDEDWYEVQLFADETLHVTLEFSQASGAEDLDLQLYRGATNLYPCDETDTSGCGASHGSSTNANENLVEPITQAGTYYVVVRGWNGAENLYDLCIGLSAADCPALP